MAVRPKVFITRAIPENGIELLKMDFEVDVWPEGARFRGGSLEVGHGRVHSGVVCREDY